VQILQRGNGNLGRLPKQAGHRSASPATPQSTQYLSKKLCLIFNLLFKKINEEFDNGRRIYDDVRFHHQLLDGRLFYRSHMLYRSHPRALILFS
jgi:hypothetical protein